MDVKFTLDEADLVALARHQMEHSPVIRRRYRIRWIGVSLGMGLMGVVLYAFLSLRAPALYLGAFAAFFLAFYPYYYRWLVGRTMGKIVNARLNPKAFAPRTLRVTPEGLELVGADSKMAKGWESVSGVEVTMDRAFVAFDGEYTIVLPRRNLGDVPFQNLIETIRKSAKLSSGEGA
jgi:hypothetical protein